MAFDNIEIEIKIEVSEADFYAAKTKIAQMATFHDTQHHVDQYYVPAKEDGYLGQHRYPYKWLSLRQRGGRAMVCFKHFFPEGAEITDYCTEHETVVADPAAIVLIFKALDVTKLVDITKERDTYVYEDQLEIVFDTVENLGYFIEIEALADQGGIAKTRQFANDFIAELGISDYRVDHRGYPFLMYERQTA